MKWSNNGGTPFYCNKFNESICSFCGNQRFPICLRQMRTDVGIGPYTLFNQLYKF
ncbi:MAG: hypothetical protein IKW03_00335 [Clostridia bacterium]|nr:hypothetical protein [Clostridia bacterium]